MVPSSLLVAAAPECKGKKLGSEARAEVVPVDEVRASDICGYRFPVVNPVYPFLSSSIVHVDHGPLDFGLFIWKLIWTEAEIGLTDVDKAFAFLSISVKVGGWRWF